MKFGFEVEYFCLQNGQPVLVPSGLPYDECGWLVEVRSDPHYDLRKALALLDADIAATQEKAAKLGVVMEQVPLKQIPRDLKVQAARQHGKGQIQYRNIYGHETHRVDSRWATASLHVSFTNESVKEFRSTSDSIDGKFIRRTEKVEKFTYQGFIDHARIIVGLDRAFAKEIKAAGRNPGFYEVKDDGRIEYRSLPNDIDREKLRVELGKLV